MVLVENEITQKNVELMRSSAEFETRQETEAKLIPAHPERFVEQFSSDTYPIEQLYLSTPHDEFSIRLRCEYHPQGVRYTATQKDRGEHQGGALRRSEITTDITQEAYEHYAARGYQTVKKLRADILEGVSIDFFDNPDTPVIVEIEHENPDMRARLASFLEELVGDTFHNRSDDPTLTSEHIAYKNTAEMRPESLDTFTRRVLGEMVAHYATGKQHVVVGLTGMSGSGKTTVTRALQQQIVELFGATYRPIVISTDDYHFGKTHLEATYGAPYAAWDSPATYNTVALATDIEQLTRDEPVSGRHFDFATEEPAIDTDITPSPFIIIEGLYAGSSDLTSVRDLHFELPTGVATSIGRDVRRLVIEHRANRAFPTPESRLRYQIETALPLYLEQAKPERRGFSASIRPLAERAFMLAAIRSLNHQTQVPQG